MSLINAAIMAAAGTLQGAATDGPRPGPAWVHDAVFYEIYPQTFKDSNGDGVGDLPGIIEKLGYVKSLGVSAIWLNPFYESPFRDAGYDVSDYYKVAPRYGSIDDARRLFAEAHRLGLRVIIDFVPGHTSIDHPWFKDSARADRNSHSNWYIWTDRTWFSGIDRNQYSFIQGYSERDGCYLTNFFWHQPALNYGFAHPDPKQPWQLPVDNPDVLALKREMEKIMRFWLEAGCDGFRVDMAGSLVKGDDGSECARYWSGVRSRLEKDYPGLFMISEWSNPIAALNGGFHADFLHWIPEYPDLFEGADGRSAYFSEGGNGDITRFLGAYLRQYRETRNKGYISLPFANHDLPRINREGRTRADIEVIYAFELSMPGVPFLYYGDEIGMRQLSGLPFTEGSYGTRAGARTPMQWDQGLNLGFSNADPKRLYRAVDPEPNAPTVEGAEKDSSSLLHFVRRLVGIRRSEPALDAGADFTVLNAKKGECPFIFLRTNGKQRMVVSLNPGPRAATASFDVDYNPAPARLVAGQQDSLRADGRRLDVKLDAASFSFYRLDESN